MRTPLTIVLVLMLSHAAMTSPAAAARAAVLLLSAKVSEYEDALKGFRETTPHQIAAVYDIAYPQWAPA